MFLNQKFRKPVRPVAVLVIAWVLVLLEACSSYPSASLDDAELSETLTDAMGKGAYAPARGFEIDSSRDVWMHDRTQLDVVMTAPKTPGNYPLIIYLPALGEGAEAGRLWRENWARAGYAVFSMQPAAISQALISLKREQMSASAETEDGQLDSWEDDRFESLEKEEGWFGDTRRRSSRVARNSDLRYLGHEYFGTDHLKSRVEHLFWAYQQLKNRVGVRQSPFASVDLSRVTLAGYDLGAQTVSAVMGENFEIGLPSSDALRPIAAVLLSPPVSLAEGNVRRRYQKMNSPILLITGSDDYDPYAISSPLARTSAWEHAPSGGKYLLVLKRGRHGELAGSGTGGRFGRNRYGDCSGVPQSMADSGHGRNPWLMNGARSGADDCFPVESGWNDPDIGRKHVAAVIGVSTAFLDAVVKTDRFARVWLDEKAEQWLLKAGAFNRR